MEHLQTTAFSSSIYDLFLFLNDELLQDSGDSEPVGIYIKIIVMEVYIYLRSFKGSFLYRGISLFVT